MTDESFFVRQNIKENAKMTRFLTRWIFDISKFHFRQVLLVLNEEHLPEVVFGYIKYPLS
jgi:hypothetical protein